MEDLNYQLQQIQLQNSREFIAQLEDLAYTKDKNILKYAEITECTICIDTFIEHQKILRIPTCKHFFHPDCLKKWFESKTQEEEQRCPQCNQELKTESMKAAKQQNQQSIMFSSSYGGKINKIGPEISQL